MKPFTEYPIIESTIKDSLYPEILKTIPQAPKKLYFRGNIEKLDFKKAIAIVGSRRMTRYGKEVIGIFVNQFVLENVPTISGFMYGVDTEVHTKTVEFGGQTIAVFGCGLDVVYPPENQELYSKILERGVVISEYEPGAKPHLWKFPRRNRIVSGLAGRGVLVIEAGEKSGSIVTAMLAHKQGRKIYVVPGPITSSVSKGTNNLIKEGRAKMVTDPGDIIGKTVKTKMRKVEGLEGEILELLSRESYTLDELSLILNKNIVELSTTLTMLSLAGKVIDRGGAYVLAST